MNPGSMWQEQLTALIDRELASLLHLSEHALIPERAKKELQRQILEQRISWQKLIQTLQHIEQSLEDST